ncbi:MAG: substrate-binding domain-containing protein [Ahrensia sp.]|nr:substrate-binding domain-containing protein [Ahrensia sp.]
MKRRVFLSILAATLTFCNATFAADKSFVLATTTSTENSGLLGAIIPIFSEKTGIQVKVVAIGTGQALAMGARGDAAALLTHDREGEDKFIANGFGTDRRDVMFNDFVLIGPSEDPANIRAATSTADALQKIATEKSLFVSRGDDSGTHRKELQLWNEAALNRDDFTTWYREAGSGMGQTIITTIEMGAYTLTDRATWAKFGRKSDYEILFASDPPLHNPYSSIVVTNTLIPPTETTNAIIWHEWLTSDEGRKAITDFQVGGQQLFFIIPTASKS